MPQLEDGQNVLRKRPRPGRPIGPLLPQPTKEIIIERESKVDVNEIAAAVVKAIGKISPITVHQGQGSAEKKNDGFDDSKTLERLADTMAVQKGNSESNFENLGRVKTTKKDKKDVQNTIDLLKDID